MKTVSPGAVSYASRFEQPASVDSYERGEYSPGSYPSLIWALQQPWLERIISSSRSPSRPLKLLDFACGTGRILSFVEPLADEAVGVDLSEQMIGVARQKCRKARLIAGNLLSNPSLLPGGSVFDVVTCFRFLLNVEPALRAAALRRLRSLVRDPGGILLVNVHGNSQSLRHPAVVWKRWRSRSLPPEKQSELMLNEMSGPETRRLLRECGWEVERQIGFGILPRTLYRTPLRGLAHAVDKALAGRAGFNAWSTDLLFVCRPCPEP
ncbi:MAG: class I SAM-dependent methyltransferase [Verrucomicrobiota bacterium]